MNVSSSTPSRLLVVMPSWVGDAAMAVPALRAMRRAAPEAHVAALCRPGIETVLEGCPLVDDFFVGHPKRGSEMMTLAGELRAQRFDMALLLPNSFKSALIARLAGIGERVGYQRDGRGLLLTRGCDPPRRPGGGYATVPAVGYYLDLVRFAFPQQLQDAGSLDERLELWTTERDEAEADRILVEAGVVQHAAQSETPPRPIVVLNPGANRADKRWPAARYAAVGDHLARQHKAAVFITGAPAEQELIDAVRDAMKEPAHDLQALDIGLGSLKAILGRASLLITNDTGPRHLGVARGAAVVTLFGPTDPRWTTLDYERQVELLANPDLPPDERADDHPDQCRIDRIGVDEVIAAAESLLGKR